MNEEILKRLDALGAKLGVTAQYLWGVLVKQARVEMLSDCAAASIAALVCLGSIFGVILARRSREMEVREVGVPVLALLAIVAGLFVVGYGFAAFTEWANPEYWALKQIMQAVAH